MLLTQSIMWKSLLVEKCLQGGIFLCFFITCIILSYDKAVKRLLIWYIHDIFSTTKPAKHLPHWHFFVSCLLIPLPSFQLFRFLDEMTFFSSELSMMWPFFLLHSQICTSLYLKWALHKIMTLYHNCIVYLHFTYLGG